MSRCADGGPWPCLEPGCPASWISCHDHLKVACTGKFSDIWTLLPTTALEGRRVAEECRKTCGECMEDGSADCELVAREILTTATPVDYEVQLLIFRLPPRADSQLLLGGSGHVKVRAPDAGNVRNRIRAYSALLDPRSRQFNLF